ncbi:MAG: hypothetical protein GAK45_00232 [Pseudomonas citronellolis]|nr:MAG: hypothetical protein GAK45_00232 [Pseudomonas citronellolis]
MPRPRLESGQVLQVEGVLCVVVRPIAHHGYQVLLQPAAPLSNSIHWNGAAWIFSRRSHARVRDIAHCSELLGRLASGSPCQRSS